MEQSIMHQKDAEKLQSVADMMKAIAHPLRIRIIELLEKYGKLNVGELMELLGENQAVVSHHLIRMKDRDVLICEKDGKKRVYKLGDPQITGIIHCISQCQININE